MTQTARQILAAHIASHLERTQKWDRTLEQHARLFEQLAFAGVEFDYSDDGDIVVRVIGDQAKFKEVWRCLRQAGWVPSSRPNSAPFASFYAWWSMPMPGEAYSYNKDFAKIWFTFSSTVCKIKKVGTKKVEVEEAIYEMECGDGQTPLGELLSSEDEIRDGVLNSMPTQTGE